MEDYRKHKLMRTHAIFRTILDDDVVALRRLLELDKNVILETSSEHWTPLHVAVINSRDTCVQLLLLNGADPLAKDIEGKTSLHWAAHSNVPFSIFEMLASGRDDCFDTVDNFGRTPLHYVCLRRETFETITQSETDKYELIRKINFLIQRASNLDQPDFEGNTPLLLLSGNIHNALFTEEVARDSLPNYMGKYKSKSLCGFTLEMLLDKGASIQVRNTHGKRPLHFACQTNCVEMVRLLLSEETPDEPPVDESGNSPITMCFLSKGIQCVSLRYDVDPSEWFNEVLLADKKVRFQDTLRPIIKQWKNVNIQQVGSGLTALHYAIMDMNCSINVIKGLVDYGKADVKIRSHVGKTPLHYGIRSTLIVPSPIADQLLENWKNKIFYLIRKGADVNAQDHGGNSPLHDACEAGDVEFIRILLDNNANPSLRNNCGATPLGIRFKLSRYVWLHSTSLCYLLRCKRRGFKTHREWCE